MRAPIFNAIPTLPAVYKQLSEISKAEFDGIELEAIAVVLVRDTFMARVVRSPFDGKPHLYSVYLHQRSGGVQCVADFATPQEAIAYGGRIAEACGLPVTGGLKELRVMHVPGKGYLSRSAVTGPDVADMRRVVGTRHASLRLVQQPADAAIYHLDQATLEPEAQWVNFADAEALFAPHDNSAFILPPSLIPADQRQDFLQWADDGGYDQSYFNRWDAKSRELEQNYLDEMADAMAEATPFQTAG